MITLLVLMCWWVNVLIAVAVLLRWCCDCGWLCWWLCWWHIVLIAVVVLLCWWLCWCVVVMTVLMTVLTTVSMCWCVDVSMCCVDVLMCWWLSDVSLCWCVDDCVDVLRWCSCFFLIRASRNDGLRKRAVDGYGINGNSLTDFVSLSGNKICSKSE
jgi:hypothetical protein